MFTNRVSFKMTLQGQLHVYETQRLSVIRQIVAIETQNFTSKFELSEESKYEMDSITKEQWKIAQNTVLQCKKKEVTILKLYFSCM